MAFNFPSSPNLNDTYTFQGKTWKWNGSGWALVTNVDIAQSAWNTANLAYADSGSGITLAQAAYNNSNTKISSAGGTFTGDVVIGSNKDLTVTGNLYVQGNTVSINTSSFTVTDSLIGLALGNYTTDTNDIGFAGHYNDGTNAHAGFIRDSANKEWYIFDSYTPELNSGNNLDVNDASFRTSNVNAGYFKGNLISDTAIVNSRNIYDFGTSSYNQANTATEIANAALSQNATFAHSNTVDFIPEQNSLPLAQPLINLDDGRLFITLSNGKVIDISSTPVGKTYHVATNGNDNYNGDTESSAKATIAAAIQLAQPGDSVIVHSGTYIENTPIIIPQNVQVQGSGERNCIVKPLDSSKNIFYVNNNSYVTGFKFMEYTNAAISFPPRVLGSGVATAGSANTITLATSETTKNDYYKDMKISIVSGTGSGQSANVISYNGTTKIATIDTNWPTSNPNNTSNYEIAIPLRTSPATANTRYSTFITGSPYIYNSSSITTTGTGIRVDGSLATGNRSIISAQFTQVNSGGKGIHILNDGYAQLVSIYGIFCDTAFLAESGGTASMGNCNVNFGNRGLVANGKGSLAMSATIANTSTEASSTLDLKNVVANSEFVTATVPYVTLIMKIDGDDVDTYYSVDSATSLVGGNTTVTFTSSIPTSWPAGTSVKFYQQSQLRASGQTFEFVGAGTSVAAIPRFGGVANTEAEIITIGEGAVFATSTDQSGNFKVSELVINQETSTISGRTFSKSLFAEMTPYILALEG
jgi:hypothetical protein